MVNRKLPPTRASLPTRLNGALRIQYKRKRAKLKTKYKKNERKIWKDRYQTLLTSQTRYDKKAVSGLF